MCEVVCCVCFMCVCVLCMCLSGACLIFPMCVSVDYYLVVRLSCGMFFVCVVYDVCMCVCAIMMRMYVC